MLSSKPPIINPTAPMVALSCCLWSIERSKITVQSNVKRRRAMNIGTLRSAVPTYKFAFQTMVCKLRNDAHM